ncbi:bifunctional acetaldehyde-CoA/alcohol dehydrogenase [Citrobacter koseri]|uniref:Bifunctional acetaldehyde-CoA/alcohol dehydrogenase n=1 Tax=Citrobacter koseri TaxID=545 RepID=A0A447UG13_CITKO|nr:bifunctional acetaldehyde-CoA/alcohol dehydrogenase [Citrobacter koseri]
MAVTNVAELNALVERVKKAQREYASFTQEQVTKSSAPPLWLPQMLEFPSLRWPLPNQAWVSSKIK